MTIHALGPFRLDTQNEVLFRGGEPVTLGGRAIALLRALVERRGALVSKDALIEAAWPGQAVEDSNLTVQIAALRRVLGEAPGADHWITTIPRRGYRFVGPAAAEVDSGAAGSPPQADGVRDLAPTPHGDAERRQITVMSCDLVGVATVTNPMGLDDLHEAIGAFRRCVAETVDRHNGFVVSRLGNSEVVLFGYPAAHEHDAERAVRAGLELCAAVRALSLADGASVRCRVGIATGTTIIGDHRGGGAFREYEIVGDAPNQAGRLQQLAQADIVVIESATLQLIGNLFDCRDLGTIDPTGHSEPMRIWQVLGESIVASRFEALRGSALTRLIGRDEEVDLLSRRWERARAGNGQVVLVSGEPGVGKSRIIAALAEQLHAEPHLRLRYSCSPYHQDSALFPIIDRLRRASGFAADDPPASRMEKFKVMLAQAFAPDEHVALLADLLSLPAAARYPLPNLSPQRKKERTLEALIR
jgi:class 3 adenylate cyclase